MGKKIAILGVRCKMIDDEEIRHPTSIFILNCSYIEIADSGHNGKLEMNVL